MPQDNFLPKNYQSPDKDSGGTDYMKIESGKNKIRIMASPILGYELWIDGKPKRYEMMEKIPVTDLSKADINKFTGEPRDPQHFWAMPVYNYQEEKIQILNITQASIRQGIQTLSNNEDWGSPLEYDIEIEKTGEGKETRYNVIPKPPKKLDESIQDEFDSLEIDMGLYFEGGHPINKKENKPVKQESKEEVNADDIPF